MRRLAKGVFALALLVCAPLAHRSSRPRFCWRASSSWICNSTS